MLNTSDSARSGQDLGECLAGLDGRHAQADARRELVRAPVPTPASLASTAHLEASHVQVRAWPHSVTTHPLSTFLHSAQHASPAPTPHIKCPQHTATAAGVIPADGPARQATRQGGSMRPALVQVLPTGRYFYNEFLTAMMEMTPDEQDTGKQD